jgi:hypothetical protein
MAPRVLATFARTIRYEAGMCCFKASAVMSACEAFHVGTPWRKTITWGDSWRTPERIAIVWDNGRWARTSTRYACTSGCCFRKASTSTKAATQVGHVGLCL